KSTTGLSIIRLYKPTSGQIIYDGHDIAQLSNRELKPYRSRLQMIFQDPYASLNPRMTVMDLIAEPIDIAGTLSGKDRADRVYELLERVGLARDHANRYPHEFSGGQRQRIGIARALASDPEFIVCDEPISALDVSIQAQVVNMLEDLQQQMGLTYLFVAHDLSMVRHISRRVGVMYLGSLVETAESQEIYEHPLHPYSKALMSAIPILDPVRGKAEKPKLLKGEIPSPLDMPPGCRFASRCPLACERCRTELPQLKEASPGHMVACHLVNE
ncbi:MAG: oligopeptide/dipeptide ABC transporter ATP-binding protein, partial [Coriobacteriales bacterium]|nr:oligopeptide/dipeptide ABC transporter ATP-binding protein [Coriobacteriales bacterium]